MVLFLPAILLLGSAAAQEFVGVGMGGVVTTSADGVNWSSQNVGGEDLWDITHNGTHYIAVGNDGTIITSTDGSSWTVQTTPGSDRHRGVGVNATHTVVVGLDGNIFTSSDGSNWDAIPSPTSDFLRSVAYGNDVWVAVGNQGSRVTSTDGANWNAAFHPDETWIVEFGEGLFVAPSNNGDVITSPDGSSWTTQTTPTSNRMRGIAHNGTDFLSAGLDDTIITSPDGAAWTDQSTPTNVHLRAAVHNGTHWAVVGESGTILTGTDGASWTARSSGTSQRLAGIASDFGPHTGTSTLDAAPATIVADGTADSTVTLTVHGENGVPVRRGGHDIALSTDHGSLSQVTDHGDGTYTATLTCTGTGMATLTATLRGAPFTDTANVDCVPGPASTSTSQVTASPTSLVADGASTSLITVRLHDASGHPLQVGGDAVTLNADLGTLSNVQDEGDGSYTATFTSGTTPGTATITAEIDGALIQDQADVVLRPGPPDGQNSLLEASPKTMTADGVSTATITLRLFDAHGNALDSGGHTVQITTTLGSLSGVTDRQDGTYEAILTAATTTGKAFLEAKVDGSPVADQEEVEFLPGDPALDKSALKASPLRVPADGTTTSTITLHLVDAHGNPIPDGHVVAFGSDHGDLANVIDHGDGTHTVELSHASVGHATVTATVDGQSVEEEAVLEFYTIVPDMEMSLLHASPAQIVADGAQASTVALTLRNEHGDVLGPAEHTVRLFSSLGDLSEVENHDDGTYTARLRGTTAGEASITATVDHDLVQATATVELLPGPPVFSKSSLGTDPAQIPADGTTASTLTLVLKDAHGNPVPGQDITLLTDLGWLGELQDLGGTYEALLRGVDPGTATITLDGLGLQAQVGLSVPDGPLAVLLEPVGLLCAEETITYRAAAHHGGQAVEKWSFDINGHVREVHPDPDAPHRIQTEHVFTNPSDKKVQVTAHFATGTASDTLEHGMLDSCLEPVVDFRYGVTGRTVAFTDLSQDPDDLIEAWHWDFGDGTSSTERHPEHTFTDFGMFLVRLTVKDAVDRQPSQERVVVVAQSHPAGTPAADAAPPDPEPSSEEPPRDLPTEAPREDPPTGDHTAPRPWDPGFTIQKVGPDGYWFSADVPPGADRITWDFGDGTTATGAEAWHAFPPGDHQITLRIEGAGQEAEVVRGLTVEKTEDTADPRSDRTPTEPDARTDGLPAVEHQSWMAQHDPDLLGWLLVGSLGLSVLLATALVALRGRRR